MLGPENTMRRSRAANIANGFVEAIRAETHGGSIKPYGLAKAVSRFTPDAAVELERVIQAVFERLEEGEPNGRRNRQVLELRLRGHSRHAVALIIDCPLSTIEFSMQVAIVAAIEVANELATSNSRSIDHS